MKLQRLRDILIVITAILIIIYLLVIGCVFFTQSFMSNATLDEWRNAKLGIIRGDPALLKEAKESGYYSLMENTKSKDSFEIYYDKFVTLHNLKTPEKDGTDERDTLKLVK